MIIVCTGIPGVGKTTVMESVRQMLEDKYIPTLIVNYGNVMFEVAVGDRIVFDRDQLRKLPTNIQKQVQKKAASQILKEAKGKTVILDTHCTIKTKGGFFPGLPRWILDYLKPHALVLVEAPPSEILERRNTDPTRRRDEDTVEEIKNHQMVNRMYAASYSAYSGCSVKIVENRQGQAEKASHDFAQIMEG